MYIHILDKKSITVIVNTFPLYLDLDGKLEGKKDHQNAFFFFNSDFMIENLRLS